MIADLRKPPELEAFEFDSFLLDDDTDDYIDNNVKTVYTARFQTPVYSWVFNQKIPREKLYCKWGNIWCDGNNDAIIGSVELGDHEEGKYPRSQLLQHYENGEIVNEESYE